MLRLRSLPLFLAIGVFGLVSPLAACGADGSGDGATSSSSGGQPPGGSSGNVPGSSSGDPKPGDTGDALVGLWSVDGTDARGAYTGEVEIRSEAKGYTFIRAIKYTGLKVEDNRDLHWVFRGTIAKNGAALTLTSALKRMDFISEKGALKRSAADATPLPVKGDLKLSAKGDEISGTISATGIAITETWRAKKALPAKPIFVDERKHVTAHDPPSTATKLGLFAAYADYHTLDVIKPYSNRAEFQNAVHGHVVDPTDLDFYRANKNAIRVADKIVDDISIAETKARADAYRYTLREKADAYQRDIDTRFVDPTVGMIPAGGPRNTANFAWDASGDGSLWTAVYLASQVFRFQVTGEQKAKDNALASLDGMLKLQEITGDWTTFARTLRKATGGAPSLPWHAGTGAFAGLEWMEGGNNDMIKGLFYSYIMGWELFCEGKTGYESTCARIRTNTKHLADDVKLGGSNAPASQLSNDLPAAWLYAIFATNLGDTLEYRAKAEGYWTVGKPVLNETAVFYEQGTVDWSGQHLTSIGDMVEYMSAQRLNLGGDALEKYRDHIDDSHKNLEKQRFANWHLLKAAWGTGAGPSSPWIKEAVGRMNEARYPKVSDTIDRRLSAEYCMSPYPSLPWKGDWMTYPSSDRTQGIDSHPLFEANPDIMYWKVGNNYRVYEGQETPGGDFLHLYWFARKNGLIGAND